VINLKDFGTTTGIIYKSVSTGAELIAYWGSITAPGNYVINVTGDLNITARLAVDDAYDHFGSGIIISLRGTGSNSITTSTNLLVDSGETIILRDITIARSTDSSDVVCCWYGSKFVMEAGSAIIGGSCGVWVEDEDSVFTMKGGAIHDNDGEGGVWVGPDGKFIMTGGEIYENIGYYSGGGVTVEGANACFEKNPGGRIYDNTTLESSGYQVSVLDDTESILRYRDTAITSLETLSITLNGTGSAIATQSGTWDQ